MDPTISSTAAPKDGVVIVATVTEPKSNSAQDVCFSVYRYREGLLHNADTLWAGPMTGQHLKSGRYYFNLPEARQEVAV